MFCYSHSYEISDHAHVGYTTYILFSKATVNILYYYVNSAISVGQGSKLVLIIIIVERVNEVQGTIAQ